MRVPHFTGAAEVKQNLYQMAEVSAIWKADVKNPHLQGLAFDAIADSDFSQFLDNPEAWLQEVLPGTIPARKSILSVFQQNKALLKSLHGESGWQAGVQARITAFVDALASRYKTLLPENFHAKIDAELKPVTDALEKHLL